MTKCSALGDNTEEDKSLCLKDDLDVTTAFEGFIVFAPRTLKGGRSIKFTNWAEKC